MKIHRSTARITSSFKPLSNANDTALLNTTAILPLNASGNYTYNNPQNITGNILSSNTFALTNPQLATVGIIFMALLLGFAYYLERTWVRRHSFLPAPTPRTTEYNAGDVSFDKDRDDTDRTTASLLTK